MNTLRCIAAAATVALSLPVFAAPTPTTQAYDFNSTATYSVKPVDGGAGSYAGFANGTYFGNTVGFAGTALQGSQGAVQGVSISAWASTGGTGTNATPTGTGSGTNGSSTANGNIQNAVVTQYSVSNGGTGTYSGQGNALGETSRNTGVNGEFTCTGNLNGTSTGNQTCATTASPTANHALDNNGAYETLLLSFNNAVTLSSVTLGFPTIGNGASVGNTDLTILYCTAKGAGDGGCATTAFGTKTYASLVSSGDWAYTNLLNLSGSNDTGNTNLNAKSQYWMIGAFIADLPAQTSSGETPAAYDYVKIRAVTTCSSAVCAVPEPSSIALLGIAGTALCIGRRRRTLRVA